jgi:putrescine aminotransferase
MSARRDELVRAAAEQMQELPFYNTFFKTATPPTVMLAAKLAGLLGGELQHVFFNSSGSEANDTVMRMVRHYWTVSGQPKRSIFISRWNAYHGSTMAGASLGGMKAMHPIGGLPIRALSTLPSRTVWRGFGEEKKRSMRAVRTRLKIASSLWVLRTLPPLSASRCRARAA